MTYTPLERNQLIANSALVVAAVGFAVQPTLVATFPAYISAKL